MESATHQPGRYLDGKRNERTLVHAVDLVLEDEVDLPGAIGNPEQSPGEIAPHPFGNPKLGRG